MLATAALSAAWAWQMQVFQVFRYWDSDEYFLMAQQLGSGEAITAAAPYAYRVLTPWLVARLFGDIQLGFLIVNLAAGTALALLLTFWLRHFVASAGVRLLMVAAYALQWHGPLRFVFYYPAYVDPLFQVFVVAALIVAERLVSRPALATGLGVAGLTALGTAARETMLMVPAAGLLGAVLARRAAEWAWPVVSLAAGIAVFTTIYFGTPQARAGYGLADAVWLHLTNKPVESILLVWFIAFGPMLAVVLFDWRATAAFLRRRPGLALLPLVCIVLAYIGGHDTERYLFWSMPVMYLLIAQSIERHRGLVATPAIAGLLVAGQLLSQRVFWPVPDPGNAVAALSETAGPPAQLYAVLNRVFVIDDFHWNLWSNFGSRPFHLVQLAFYLALSAVIILMLQRRAASQVAPA